MLTTYDDIIGKPATQQNAPDNTQAAPQQAAETTAQAATPQAGVATQVAATPVTNTAAAPAGTATQQTTQATQAVAQPTQQKTPMSYADMFVAMNPYKPMTPEERAAEAKRNRRNAMFAAISDGISALSNLYFTTKGAPNSFNGGSTLSGKMYERQRQLEKEREAMDKDYINGYLRAMEMDRNRDTQDRNYRYQMANLNYRMSRQAALDEEAKRKNENAQKNKERELEEKERHNKENEKTARIKANKPTGKTDKNKTVKTNTYYVGNKIVHLPVDEVGDDKIYINGLASRAGIMRSKFKNDVDFRNAVVNSPEVQELIMSDANQYGARVSERNASGKQSTSLLPSSGKSNTSLLPQQ